MTRSERKQLQFELAEKLGSAIVEILAPHCEAVVHDFTDLAHSIVFIAGDVTGRSVGGSATDLILERARTGRTREDLFNYRTRLQSGTVMKSSTVFLRDEGGTAFGALCINLDVTDFARLAGRLDSFLAAEGSDEVSELISDNIEEVLESMITRTLGEMGVRGPILAQRDRIELIQRLDAKGVFNVQRSVPIVAELMGLSRGTVYNYMKREAQDGEVMDSDGR